MVYPVRWLRLLFPEVAGRQKVRRGLELELLEDRLAPAGVTEPPTIRVGPPEAPPAPVQFDSYVQDVLPNEWPSGDNWPAEAYKAGAVAAKMYGWYRIEHPVSSSFDVYSDANSQVYKATSGQSASALQNTDPAIASVGSVGMEKSDGTFFLSEYWNGRCAVQNSDSTGLALRPQPGLNNTPITQLSEGTVVYVIDNGETQLDGYRWFRVAVNGVLNPTVQTGYVAADYLKGLDIGAHTVTSMHGQVTQYGTVYWAVQGLNYQQILHYFYDGSKETGGQNIQFFAVSAPPRVYSFHISGTSSPVGSPITISTSASGGSSPIKQVELWRTDYLAYSLGSWPFPIQTTVLAGNSYSGSFSFTDTPPVGTWVYGVHVVNTQNVWNDERNSQSGFAPGVWGPAIVNVYAVNGYATQVQQVAPISPAAPLIVYPALAVNSDSWPSADSSTHAVSWLENKSGYTVPSFNGTNPTSADLQDTMRQLASQYSVPIEIVAAVCYQESKCRQYDPTDGGFIIRNVQEDTDLYLGNAPTSSAPPGLGLMQLTGATARQYDVNQLITNWRYNLSAGVQELSRAYDWATFSDPPWMKTLDTQNRSILENWFYALAKYNGFKYNGYYGGSPYPYQIYGWIANPPPEIAGLFSPVTVTPPQNVIASWRYGTSFVATASGTWYTQDGAQYQSQVHPSGGGQSTSSTAVISDFVWQSQKDMPQATEGAVAAESRDGKIHVLGGTQLTAHYVYDPATNQWQALANMPAPGVMDGGAAFVNSKLYAIGNNGFTAVTRIYDPTTDSWGVGSPMPTLRDSPMVEEVGGKIYVIGGRNWNDGHTANTVEAYDPATDSWKALSPMLTSRFAAAITEVDGLIYVMGGQKDGNISRAVEVYDPVADKWATKQPMSSSLQRDWAAATPIGGKIYLMGGRNGANQPLASVLEYDPVADAWRTLPSGLRTARFGALAVPVNGQPYVIGGQVDAGIGVVGLTVPTTSSEQGTARYVPTVVASALGGSSDPNSITGPTALFVKPTDILPYRIDFENDAAARLPAQRVIVSDQLDSNVDWTTFQVGDFNIGGTMYHVAANQGSFSTRLDLRGSLGIYVDVTAGVDKTTGVATWTFTSIDPATGAMPASFFTGFLPPNTTAAQGEGFVTYLVQPLATDSTRTRIDAQATVYFDANDPVATPQVSHFVDAGPPTSSVNPLPATENSPRFTVSWAGQDDPGGSGVASYDVYVSDNGGPFTRLFTATTQTSMTFQGTNGHTYAFYSVAADNVGNVQRIPTASQARTEVHLSTAPGGGSGGSGTTGGPGTSSGTVFIDYNANGIPDPGEPSLAGRTLFLDVAGSGVLGPGDPTTTSDANGNFQFTALSAGTYTVREVLFGGVLLSTPVNGSYQVVVASGANVTGRNFGEFPTSITVPLTLPPTTPFPAHGNANADFVEAVYRAVLDRNSDPGGLAAWTSLLNAGALSRLQVVQGIRNSPEHFAQEIEDFYLTLLGRAADAGGLTVWVRQLQNGVSEEQICFDFLDSPEYTSRGDKFFVDTMYLSLLGRSFDASGEAFWLSLLGDNPSGAPGHPASLTHEQVIHGFLYSTESLSRLIEGYYEVFLQRAADAGGLSTWLTQLQQGVPFLTIGQDFLASNEFFARSTVSHGVALLSEVIAP